MDVDAYHPARFADPAPEPRFEFAGIHGVAIFFADYDAALSYYTNVLGPPGYIEGSGTRGWRLGDTWLTLLAGGDSAPSGVEIPIVMATPEAAERLRAAFMAAGGTGPEPSDQLMYEPVRSCPVTDPFGTSLLVYAPLG